MLVYMIEAGAHVQGLGAYRMLIAIASYFLEVFASNLKDRTESSLTTDQNQSNFDNFEPAMHLFLKTFNILSVNLRIGYITDHPRTNFYS